MRKVLLAVLVVFGCLAYVTDGAYTIFGYVGANVYCYSSTKLLTYISNQRYPYNCAAYCNKYSTCKAFWHYYYNKRCYLYKTTCTGNDFRYWNYWYYEYQEKAPLTALPRPENIAFKKTSLVSSALSTTTYKGANAVDGFREATESRAFCFVTALKKTNPHWWLVDLANTYDVQSIFLLNGVTYYRAANTKVIVAPTYTKVGDKLTWKNGTECGSIGSSKLDVGKASGKWFHCPDPAKGRYVIFYKKPADYYLVLCEVEVYQRKDIHNVLSFEKSTDAQGTLSANLEPSRCVDGWASPYFESKAVFRSTVNDPAINKWWMVDFGSNYQVRKVSLSSVMYFDLLDKQHLLSYITVYTSTKFTKDVVTPPSGIKMIDMDGYKECNEVGYPQLPKGSHVAMYCPDKQVARFVILVKKYASMKTLSLSEVEVRGHAPNGVNLAHRQNAMQVDNIALGNSESAKGSDGLIAPKPISDKKCISTPGSTNNDWWTVDLTNVYRIKKIVLTSLSNAKLEDFKIVSSVVFDPSKVGGSDSLTCYESTSGLGLGAGLSWQMNCKPNYGRYVTILKTKKGQLQFCELEVYGEKHDNNLAYGNPAMQSTTYWHYHPYLAVDGNTSPDFAKKTCSQTLKTQTGPKWWAVDLRTKHSIGAVKISNVKKCGANCFRNFKILVSDAFNSASYSSNKFLLCYAEKGTMVSPSVQTFACNTAVEGRYVVLETLDTSYALTLCEVEIYSSTDITWANLAFKKTASQSNNQPGTGGRAGLAVDGFKNSNYNSGFCAMTSGKDQYEWLSVDLKTKYIIRKVVVTNRGDAWASYMRNVFVSVVEKFDSTKFASNFFYTCAVINSMLAGEVKAMHCRRYLVGQYVVLRKTNVYRNSPLSVCELEVYGSPYSENIAFRQQASQSSAMFPESKASSAVDSFLGPDYHFEKRCTSTAGKVDKEWWAVDLVKTYTVSWMVMIVSGKCRSCGFDAEKGLEGVEARTTRELFTSDVFRTAHRPCFKLDSKTLKPGEAAKAKCEASAIGRYAVLVKPSSKGKPLVLCEVEVFGTVYTYSKSNLLLNKIAKVSTEGSGKADSSQGANDGVPNPKISGGSCAQTKGVNKYEWWMVDMGDYYNISKLIIANSANSGDDNLKGVDILLTMDFNQDDLNIGYPGAYIDPSSSSGGSSGGNTVVNGTTAPPVTTTQAPATGSWNFHKCAELKSKVAPGTYLDVACNVTVTARYMIIMKNNTVNNSLVLCEVEAFGTWVYVPTTAPMSTSSTTEEPTTPPAPPPPPVKTTPVVGEPEPAPSSAGAIVGAVIGVLACTGAGVAGFFGYKHIMAQKAAAPTPRQIAVKEVKEPSTGEADDGSQTDRRPRSVTSIQTTVNHE